MNRIYIMIFGAVILVSTAAEAGPVLKPYDKTIWADSNNRNCNSPMISPEKARKVPFVPGWSGGWNAEFTDKGPACQLFKIHGAFISGIGIITAVIHYSLLSDYDNWRAEDAAESTGWGFTSVFEGMCFYLPFAVFDAEYSSEFIKKYSSGKGDAYKNADKKGVPDALSFKPYIVWRKKTENERKAFDGLGICLKYEI